VSRRIVSGEEHLEPQVLQRHVERRPQATILGFTTASVMRFLGIVLILFAIETALIARSQGALGRFRSWIVAANWVTVALAVVVIALWHAAFSAIGMAAAAIVAVAVGIFAALQQRSL